MVAQIGLNMMLSFSLGLWITSESVGVLWGLLRYSCLVIRITIAQRVLVLQPYGELYGGSLGPTYLIMMSACLVIRTTMAQRVHAM